MAKTLHWDCKNNSIVAGPSPTVVRAGATATRRNSSGNIEAVAANTLRLDHDWNGTPLGWLREDARTNVHLYSEDLSTGYNYVNCTVDTNVSLAPDGNTAMDRINVTAGAGVHHVRATSTFSITSGSDMEYSAYIKDDGAGFVALVAWINNGNRITVVANLTTGAITDDTQVGATSGSITDSGVEDCGGDIYRVWMVGSFTSASAVLSVCACDSGTPTYTSGGLPTYTAVAGEDLFVWGLQVAVAANGKPSTYIPTTSSSSTRAADEITLSDLSWFNESQGTFYARALRYSEIINTNVFQMGATEYLWMTSNSLARAQFLSQVSAGNDISLTAASNSWPKDTLVEMVGAYAQDDAEFYVDGTRTGTGDQTIDVPISPAGFYLGSAVTGGNVLNGVIGELRYYDERLDNDTLLAMSNGTFPVEGGGDEDFFLRRRKIARLRQRQRRR